MAKQCCVCMKKLGFFNSGGELDNRAPGNMLCDECFSHKLKLQTAQDENDLSEKMLAFRNRANHSKISPHITEIIDSLEKQAWDLLDRKQKVQEQKQIARLDRFNGVEPEYEFTSEMHTLIQHYTTCVYVFKDSVMINRVGTLNGLPSDITLYYRDITAIQLGSMSGRPRITFTVPGMSIGSNALSAPVTKSVSIASANVDHYTDPCSIVFGLNEVGEAQKCCDIIKRYFHNYKANEQTTKLGAMVPQYDGPVDKLKKLKDLKDMGILSDAEYEEKRQKLLSEI